MGEGNRGGSGPEPRGLEARSGGGFRSRGVGSWIAAASPPHASLRSGRRCHRARGDCCRRGAHVRSDKGSYARLRIRKPLDIPQPHERRHIDAPPATAKRAPRARGQRQRARLPLHSEVELLLDLPLQPCECQAALADELTGTQPVGEWHARSERRGSQLRSPHAALPQPTQPTQLPGSPLRPYPTLPPRHAASCHSTAAAPAPPCARPTQALPVQQDAPGRSQRPARVTWMRPQQARAWGVSRGPRHEPS